MCLRWANTGVIKRASKGVQGMPGHFDPALLQLLCERASKEMDPEKLLRLTRQINELLDLKEQATKAGQSNKKSA